MSCFFVVVAYEEFFELCIREPFSFLARNLMRIVKSIAAHVWCKTNNNIVLFYPFVQDANDSFFPCFALVLCIMMSAVPFYMDHKPL